MFTISISSEYVGYALGERFDSNEFYLPELAIDCPHSSVSNYTEALKEVIHEFSKRTVIVPVLSTKTNLVDSCSNVGMYRWLVSMYKKL